MIELQNRLSVAYYVKEYLYKLEKEIHLLPSNIGIESKGIEESIAKYNDLVLKKRNLLTSKNIKNPFSVELNNDLRATRELILLSVNDLIKNLTFHIKNI